MLGFDIFDWSGEGVLVDVNKVAEEEHWDAVIPDVIKPFANPRMSGLPLRLMSFKLLGMGE